MSWLDDLGDQASKSFAGDKVVLLAVAAGALVIGAAWWLLGRLGAVDPIFGCEQCKQKKVELVLVEFADRTGSLAAFPGVRSQYVNLTRYGSGDAQVTSDFQLFRYPAIVVKVEPPMATTVTVRLVREERGHGFGVASAALSARESGLEHLNWSPEKTATIETTDDGNGYLQPGMAIPAQGGYRYQVEGSVAGKPFVRSSNAVNVRRRIAIRPVVRYKAGAAAALSALAELSRELDELDIELFMLPTLVQSELGVLEGSDLLQGLAMNGVNALNAPPEVQGFNPYALAVIVTEFMSEPIPPHTFERELPRPPGGQFPVSVPLALEVGGFDNYVVPLTNGTQFQGGSIAWGTPPVLHELRASEVSGLDRFSGQVTVDLSRFMPLPPSATTITVSVKLKALGNWPMGMAYDNLPVIRLNMRDPKTDTVLDAHAAKLLVVHELGHKLLLSSDGTGSLPDKPPHFYTTFSRNGYRHTGDHCSSGIPDGTDLATVEAGDAADCTMWGQMQSRVRFCPECRTTLRKVDLSKGI